MVTAARRGGTVVRDGVRYRQLPIGWAGPRGGQLLFHALLAFAVRRIRHDLWIESFTPPFSTSFLPLFSPAPVVGLAQNLSGEEMWRRYRLPFFLVERFGLRFYKDVVVLNPADRARVSGCNPAAEVRVIPNGMDLPEVDEECSSAVSTSCSWAGSTSARKGWTCCFRRTRGAGWPCRCSSQASARGARSASLRRCWPLPAAMSAGSAMSPASRSGSCWNDSAFVVLPSRYESFGLAALEGMAYGKPVVHFDLPSLRWMDGDVRVPAFDVSALAAQLADLADHEKARLELGRAARAAAQRYRQEVTAVRYLELVRQILHAPSMQALSWSVTWHASERADRSDQARCAPCRAVPAPRRRGAVLWRAYDPCGQPHRR